MSHIFFNLLVNDYGAGIDWYVTRTGLFTVWSDAKSYNNVVLEFHDRKYPFHMRLALARGPHQAALVGRQAAGETLLALPTLDCDEAVARLKRNGVAFEGEIVETPYGALFARCFDCFGNKIALVEDITETLRIR